MTLKVRSPKWRCLCCLQQRCFPWLALFDLAKDKSGNVSWPEANWNMSYAHFEASLLIYSKTSLTNHLHSPKRSLMQYNFNDRSTTSLRGPFKGGPIFGRFREVLLYSAILKLVFWRFVRTSYEVASNTSSREHHHSCFWPWIFVTQKFILPIKN